LYALGEEKTKGQIDEIINKYGKGGVIPYEGFRQFMITILGVSDTKDDILNSFILINKGNKWNAERMELLVNDDDLKYISETAPKEGNGYNFVAWTSDVFSR
jgi:Ca2+-binding EF-hand superfamily protein